MPVVPHVVYADAADAIAAVHAAVARLVHGASFAAVDRVVARPVVRVWPPERAGAIETTRDLNPFRREALRFREALDAAVARRPAQY